MPCTTCDTYYDPSRGCDTPIRWLSPGAVCAGPSPPGARLPQDPGVWCETCNCVVRVLICECVREELRNNRTATKREKRGWCEIIGNRGVCSRGGHNICLPTQQETTALNATRLRALQKWRRDLKNELVPQLLRHLALPTQIDLKPSLGVEAQHDALW